MKRELIATTTRGMSNDDWLRFRKRGIGASEVGAIMGLSPYTSKIELFYEKIGEGINYKVENIAMFNGKELESYVAKMWEYWAGTEESMIQNYRTGNKVRRMQRVNAYIQNPKWPWLFVSLDRKINKGDKGKEGALEIKTIAGYESDKWAGGIPPSHIIQVQTQCGVCEFEFGELAALRDGRFFDVYEFDLMPHLWENIVDSTHDFWQKVEEGRKLLTQRYEAQTNFNMRAVEELTQQLHSIEPEPDGSEAFENFLKEKYRIANPGEREGTIIELEAAREHKTAKEKIKEYEAIAREKENYLKNQLKDMTVLNFGGDGLVSWRADVNKSRRFNNRVKL